MGERNGQRIGAINWLAAIARLLLRVESAKGPIVGLDLAKADGRTVLRPPNPVNQEDLSTKFGSDGPHKERFRPLDRVWPSVDRVILILTRPNGVPTISCGSPRPRTS